MFLLKPEIKSIFGDEKWHLVASWGFKLLNMLIIHQQNKPSLFRVFKVWPFSQRSCNLWFTHKKSHLSQNTRSFSFKKTFILLIDVAIVEYSIWDFQLTFILQVWLCHYILTWLICITDNYIYIFIYFSDIHSTMSSQKWLTSHSKYKNIYYILYQHVFWDVYDN